MAVQIAIIDNLTTALNNKAAALAQALASPKPSYSLDGESYSWTEYVTMLEEGIARLKQAIIREGGPFEVKSRGGV